ncbi:hypothetical protein HG531_003042 [Fusarium graminearum]|nr:hypothetical protein HG531_003042 [Fusarium graminearum]
MIRDRVLSVLVCVHLVTSSLTSLLALDIDSDGLLDGNLDSALCDETDIGTRETSRVKLLGSVGGTNNENVLLGSHTVHLCEKLVDNTVGSTAGVTHGTTTGLGNGVKLVKEDNTRSSGTGLVKDVSDVALRLTKPHAEEFRSLDGDEVGSTLVGDGLGQHSFTSTRRTKEQHTSGRRHAELEVLLGVIDRVLDVLLEILLDLLETTNILPANVGNLDNGDLAESGGVGDTESEAEVLHCDTKGVEDLGIDCVLIEIDQIHLLTNLLHGSLRAEGGNIGTNVTMCLGCNLLQVDIVTELHVLGVDLENLETTSRVGDTNVDLTIESAESSKSGVDRVGSVGGGHDNDVGTSLHTVHEGKKLRNDSSLDLTVSLFTLGSDGVNLVDEDNGGRVLLGFLKGLSQVRLRLTSHLRHDLGTVDEEEEGTSLVGNSSGHQSLTSTGRSEKQNTSRRLNTNRLEKLGMSERKLNHLSDLGHLLSASTNIVVTDLVEVVLLLVALNGLTLAMNDSILCDDTVLWGVDLDDLELYLPHATTDDE